MKRSNRIMWVSPHCWPDYVLRPNGLGIKSQGGQTIVMYQATCALTRQYPELYVDIYARMEQDEPKEKTIHHNVSIIRLKMGDPNEYLPKEEFWGPPIAEFVDRINDYARKHNSKYDILHGHYTDGWYVAHHLSYKWNVPFVLTTHSLGIRKRENALRQGEGKLEQLNEKYNFPARIQSETAALRNADLVLPLTVEEGEYICKYYGVSPDKIEVVNNGVVPEDFWPVDKKAGKVLREEIGVKDDEYLVTLIARVDERKGQRELIEAAPWVVRGVREKIGKNVKFCLVSWVKNDLAKSLERRIDELQIGDNIILYPPVKHNDIFRFFWASDLYALTSTYDIFPIVLLEAMCSGLPVVATKNGGPSEVIENGVDGILVEPRNTPEVAEAMIKILGDDELRISMGEAAHKKVIEKYTWDKIAIRLKDIYDRVIEQRNSKKE